MNRILSIDDFRKEFLTPHGHFYFSHILPDGKEICLEPCLNGYDVAIYQDQELIESKQCTRLSMQDQLNDKKAAITKALVIANEFYEKYTG